MSTFSPNLDLELVARGGDVGTWDTPTNSNWSIVDSVVGGIATITLNNTNVVLSAAQYQCRQITFVSTLTGSVSITFPTSFTKSYDIQNLCTGSSAFIILLVSAGLEIGCPPGEVVEVVNDGTNMYYKNLGRIGTYIDFAVSTPPAWITNSGVNPYLLCNGGTFSSATYPVLTTILGGTTLPDRRGTVAANLDQGAGRLTNIGTLFQIGGDQNLQSHTHTTTVGNESATHTHAYPSISVQVGNGGAIQYSGGVLVPLGSGGGANASATESAAHNHVVTVASAGAGAGQNLQPTTVMGITMIRAG